MMGRLARSLCAARLLLLAPACLLMLAPACERGPRLYDAEGSVTEVRADLRQVMIDHEDIPGLMPAMTMNFDVADPTLLEGLAAGDHIHFKLSHDGDSYRIVAIERRGSAGSSGVAGSAGVAGGGGLSAVAPEAEPAPLFELVDQDGAPFGDERFGDAVHVVGFVFTRCTTVCPFVTASLSRLAERYDQAKEDGVGLLLVSVDPQHDTPPVLREFARQRGLDPERWRLLTGEPEAVRRLVVEGFLVAMGEPEGAGGLIEIAHTGRLVLIDRDGGIRGYYDTSEEGLDEVFHRSRTVARSSGRARR